MQLKLTNGDTAETIVLVDANGVPILIGGQNTVQVATPLTTETIVMTDNNIDGTLFLKPSTSVKASDVFTITSGQNALAGEQVVIGANVYTYVAAVALPYDVKIGANAAASALNLSRAVNAGAGAGTLYGTGTAVHPLVTATDHANGTVTMTAIIAGTVGNSIQAVESGANLAFATATLANGTDSSGTIAACTVTLPTDGNSRIGQIRRIMTNQIITALTVDGATTILNNATTLALGKTLQYQKIAADEWAGF